MTPNVADGDLGLLARRQHDLFERVTKGSLPIEKALQLHKEVLGIRVVTVNAQQSWAKLIEFCGFDNVLLCDGFDPNKHLPPLGFSDQQEVETNLRKRPNPTSINGWLDWLDDNRTSREKLAHPITALTRVAVDPQEQNDSPLFTVWCISGQLWCLDLGGLHGKRGLRIRRIERDYVWHVKYRAIVSTR